MIAFMYLIICVRRKSLRRERRLEDARRLYADMYADIASVVTSRSEEQRLRKEAMEV